MMRCRCSEGGRGLDTLAALFAFWAVARSSTRPPAGSKAMGHWSNCLLPPPGEAREKRGSFWGIGVARSREARYFSARLTFS